MTYKKTEIKHLSIDTESRIYYVRIRRKGKRPLFESLDTRNKKTACQLLDEKIREYLGHAQKRVIKSLYKEEVEEFLKSYVATVKPTTFKRMQNVYTHKLIPYWGNKFLDEVSPGEWNKYLAIEGTKDRDLSNDKKAMSLLLNYAHGEGRLEKVPTLTDVKSQSDVAQEFTEDEIRAVLTKADNDSLRLAILIAYKCGPRVGEIVTMKWKSIHWSENTITVTGKNGTRKIWASDFVFSLLRGRKAGIDSEWVFPQPTNPKQHISTNGLDNIWQKCKAEAEVFKRFHDLRHTAITGWLRQGKSVVWIAKQVGNSVRMIMTVYDHLNIKDIGDLGEAVSVKGEAQLFQSEKEK